MTSAALLPDEKRKWYGLALRHLRMTTRLLRVGFADGSVFNTYHAFECIVSSFIAANGYPVPPQGKTKLTLPSGKLGKAYAGPGGTLSEQSTHKAKLILFDQLADRTKPYYITFSLLSRFITPDDRNNALYYDQALDLLPHERYNASFANAARSYVRAFGREVWREIR